MHRTSRAAQKAVQVRGLASLAEQIAELASQQLIIRALKNGMLLILNDICMHVGQNSHYSSRAAVIDLSSNSTALNWNGIPPQFQM